jgi:hypothetical protein
MQSARHTYRLLFSSLFPLIDSLFLLTLFLVYDLDTLVLPTSALSFLPLRYECQFLSYLSLYADAYLVDTYPFSLLVLFAGTS